ncbi:MAG: histone deacetylase family protein [Thermoproteus sp.]
MKVYYTEIFKGHEVGAGHPENPRRLDYALLGVKEADAAAVEPRLRDDVRERVETAHRRDYVNYVEDLCNAGSLTELDGDTWISPGTCRAAYMAVSAILDALDSSEHAYVLARPPGHHAGASGRALTAPTQGFCIFNTAAIGALYLEGTAVVDIDVHHGNGTQEILYDRDVLYISTHQDPLTIYPGTGFPDDVGRGRGEGYNVNVPMPPGLGDDGFKRAVDEIIMPILRQYGPRRVVVSLGWDAHREDPLADMGLSLNGYRHAIRSLLSLRVPVVFLLEGGYNYDVLREGSKMLVREMAGLGYAPSEEQTVSDHRVWNKFSATLREVKTIHSRYWRLD